MNAHILPTGKLPPGLLNRILAMAPQLDSRVLLGPGIGLDCAVLDLGTQLLVIKSDPITFTSDSIGWYVVQISANDIATCGGVPRWMLLTALLPEGHTDEELVLRISQEAFDACRALNISVIGGHTEITHGLDRPILVGTLIGEVERSALVTPRGALPGDAILLTKGVPIEGTAILAREFPDRLIQALGKAGQAQAADYLFHPGISVVRDAQIACRAGRVTAMHDPTEGGLMAAVWELAEACGHTLVIDPLKVIVPDICAKVCKVFDLDPMATIASGALLLTCPAADAAQIEISLQSDGIACATIGQVEPGNAVVWQVTRAGRVLLPRPDRDQIGKVFR